MKTLTRFLPIFLIAAVASAQQTAPLQDAPAIDPAKLLEALKGLQDAQDKQAKTALQSVLKAAQAGAAGGPAAAASWIEAVRQTQFEGVEKEGAAFREWKDKEGALFSEKEVQAAAVLHFRWLTITTERAMGRPLKDLIPTIIQYTKDVLADAAVMENLAEHADKEKDRQKPGMARNNRGASETDRIKREHDNILNRALPAGPPVKALRAEEIIKADNWEMQPGDVDGIYNAIVLPEFRKNHDQRVLEYWDMKMKLEGEAVKAKSAFEQEKFGKERRAELLWNRAKEFNELGLHNRCINELFQVLRSFPQHSQFRTWVAELEGIISPAAAPVAGAPAQK
jgi:hypothetical protein